MCKEDKKRYMEILLEIAKTQKQLLSYCMDWQQRVPVRPPGIERTGLFGLKKRIPLAFRKREELLEKLELLKEKAGRQSTAAPNEYFWWEIPWENVEKAVLFDVCECRQDGNWRFEHTWDKVPTESANALVFLEEGHCSSFDGRKDLEFYKTSCYSEAEQQNMMQKYSEQIKQKELSDRFMLDGYLIRSAETGQLYNSIQEYQLSAEHYLSNSYYKQAYQDSLSTQHERNTVQVSSHSIHYHSAYFVAEYLVSEHGLLAAWNLQPYTLLDVTGDLPKMLVEKREEKDATVASAAFLADQTEIQRIPCSLLGKNFTESTADVTAAIRYAEIITCIADKLYIDPYGEM